MPGREAHQPHTATASSREETATPGLARAAVAELAQIRADGFNAVILVIPWPGFQVSLQPPRYDPALFLRLQRVLAAAEAAGLFVVGRVGFAWQFNPDNSPRPRDRCAALLTSPAAAAAWEEYLGALHAAVSPAPNYLFSLWSWEEASCLFGFMGQPLEQRRRLASATGFQEFALARGLALGLAAAIPAASGTPPQAVSAYWDFCNHVWRELLAKGREVMPGLTMELRVDSNPVVQPNGSVHWQQSDYQLGLGEGEVRGLYWSPSWGTSSNSSGSGGAGGEGMSAGTVLRLLGALLRQLIAALAGAAGAEATHASSSSSSSPPAASAAVPPVPLLFLDQFNFIDNTPAMAKLPRLAPAAVPEFLAAAAPLLLNSTAGYGLWVYRDYRQSSIYNPSFELGLRGWRVEGCCAAAVPVPALVPAPASARGNGTATAGLAAAGPGGSSDGGRKVLQLEGKGSKGVAVHTSRPNPISEADCDGGSSVRSVCLELQAAPGTRPGAVLTVILNGETQQLAAAPSLQHTCLDFRPPQHDMWLNLTLEVVEGDAVLVDWVTCHCHVQRMGFRGVDGAPGELYENVGQLNRELDRVLK
jgi:hypothetical protein